MQESPQLSCDDILSFVSSQSMNIAVKCSRCPLQHLESQSSDNIRLFGDERGSLRGLRTNGSDKLGAVDESETLLGAELDGGEVVTLEDVLSLAPSCGW